MLLLAPYLKRLTMSIRKSKSRKSPVVKKAIQIWLTNCSQIFLTMEHPSLTNTSQNTLGRCYWGWIKSLGHDCVLVFQVECDSPVKSEACVGEGLVAETKRRKQYRQSLRMAEQRAAFKGMASGTAGNRRGRPFQNIWEDRGKSTS